MIEVKAYICEYCKGNLTMDAEQLKAHEAHCHMNPATKLLICNNCTNYTDKCLKGVEPTKCNSCMYFNAAGVIKTPAVCRTCMYSYNAFCAKYISCSSCPIGIRDESNNTHTMCRCDTVPKGVVCKYYKEII